MREQALEVAHRLGMPSLQPRELPPPPESYGLPLDSVLAVPASGQVLYRLVRDSAAGEGDFVARALKKRPFGDTPLLLHSGVSMFAEATQAASRARRSPILIAEMHLHADREIYVAKTLMSEGHYTVWGLPDDLLQCVVGVAQAG
jgi:hypothetical protein